MAQNEAIDRSKPPVPNSWLVAAAILWVALVPVAAWLAGVDTFEARVAEVAISAILGTVFAFFVAGLLLDRWERKRRQEAEKRESDALVNRTRYLVGTLLEDARSAATFLALEAYSVLSSVLDPSEVIDEGYIRKDVLRSSGTSPRDAAGPDPDGPLATAAEQARDWMTGLQHTFETYADFHLHEAYRQRKPSDEDLAAAIDPGVLTVFSARVRDLTHRLESHAEAVYSAVDEFDRRQPERQYDLLGAATAIRQASRQLRDSEVQPDPFASDDTESAANTSAARTALAGGNAVAEFLRQVVYLQRNLWSYEYHFRQRLEKEEGVLGFVGDVLESDRQKFRDIDRRMWELNRPGSGSRDAVERARELLDQLKDDAAQ
jgi:hypothetical protein